jgi:Uma2 family endonuclease
MDARVSMTMEEYLHASFDGADRDYVDGEAIERNMGELPHARLQARLMQLLTPPAERLGLEVLPEIRIQTTPTRFRVADIAVWRAGSIGQRNPTVAPLLVVEILSAEDRLVRLQSKIQEYLRHGVKWVWVVDPDERRALRYSPADPGGAPVDELQTNDPDITIALADLLSVLD